MSGDRSAESDGSGGAQRVSELRAMLDAAGLRPKKSLGQNFLIDRNFVSKVAANVGEGDLVLEVGPGTGTLTEEMLDRGARVVAIELDDGLVELLRHRWADRLVPDGAPDKPGAVRLIHGDCLAGKRSLNAQAATALAGQRFRLVANLPYHAATPLIMTLMVSWPGCVGMDVTIQREVAERLTAGPGGKAYGAISVVAASVMPARMGAGLPASCFWPKPGVVSAIMHAERTDQPLTEDPEGLSAFCQRVFAGRRKQLGTVLKGAGLAPKQWPDGISGSMRVEQLTPEQIAGLERACRREPEATVDDTAVIEASEVAGPELVASTLAPLSPVPVAHDASEIESLGVALGPSIHEACGDRLGELAWFRSPWQRSGAATGRSTWRLPDGRVIDAIVKVPVGYREYFWMSALGETDPMRFDDPEFAGLPVPRVLARGTELGGYDVAWVVLERVRGETVARSMTRMHLLRLFDAAARFHRTCASIRPPEAESLPPGPNWDQLLERSIHVAKESDVPEGDRWLRALEKAWPVWPEIVEIWENRPLTTWCHGDLHPGNVIGRDADPSVPGEPGACVLIDLGMVRPGHWIEDGLYLERLYWGREQLLRGLKPVEALAEARERFGYTAKSGVRRLAHARRVLMAATSPAFRSEQGDSVYLHAAVEVLERALGKTGVV